MIISIAMAPILSLPDLVRAIEVNKTQSHHFFIGAGASITSGVLSAYDCIWEWKRKIFLTHNPTLETQFSALNSTGAKQRIQVWLDNMGGYPLLDSSEEYSVYAERAYPIPDDRRQYFQNIVEAGKPFAGYNILCLLSEAGLIKEVWTTNFDNLIEKAAANHNITFISVGLDSTARAMRIENRQELKVFYLHGDYRYDTLRNTAEELREQDNSMKGEFIRRTQNSHLIVSGYSGRDGSVMEMFTQAYSQPGPGRLYWCGVSAEPSTLVSELIEHATRYGRQAFYIPTQGFDDLLLRVGKLTLSEEMQARARPHYERLESLANQFQPFTINCPRIDTVIKSNLFPVALPDQLYQFACSFAREPQPWKRLKELTAGRNLVCGLLKGKVYCIGSIGDIQNTFGGLLEGAVQRTPLAQEDVGKNDGVIKHILQAALVKALAAHLNCSSDEKEVIWNNIDVLSGTQRAAGHNAFKSLVIKLVWHEQGYYLLLKPSVKIVRTDGQKVDKAIKQRMTASILDRQYNGQFNNDLMDWRSQIFASESLELRYPIATIDGARFTISRHSLFAKVFNPSQPNRQPLQDNPRFYKLNAIKFDEPRLTFSSSEGDRLITDVHPLRGLVMNKPFDYSLTRTGLATSVKLGIICAPHVANKFHTFLSRFHDILESDNPKENYVITYPGFSQAYGTHLVVPAIGSTLWHNITANSTGDIRNAVLSLAQSIKSGIASLKAIGGFDVIVICIPELWENLRGYTADGEIFDLHDHIKAYAIQHGVTTQFLEEHTLTVNGQQSRIRWWLSLSLYCKSYRTPWVLHGLDANTAFAGIGFSIDNGAQDGPHVVMGCSHIYDDKGQGLNFRLSKIERPIFINRRPHLSYDDAFNFSTGIRQMFFESQRSSPSRVVIHKRVGFTAQEKQGILDGLKDIKNIDLIEINIEEDVRFLASKQENGQLAIDSYPVHRGTCVLINSSTAMLFSHGLVPPLIQGKRSDFMGGRGIPSPLVIRKHHGASPLEKICMEILGLTKMNWNSASLYSKLPATLQSSSEIARIGSLLARFSGTSYDYRLFI